MGKLDKVYGDLHDTLMSLMDLKLTNGVLAIFAIHAEEIGKEILDNAGMTPPTGIIILKGAS